MAIFGEIIIIIGSCLEVNIVSWLFDILFIQYLILKDRKVQNLTINKNVPTSASPDS